MITKFTEKGQALIVIAIAAVVLFGFSALAIDGSMAFSIRRQSANAADAASLSAALAKTRGNDWRAAAMASALTNKFNDDTTTNEVDVYQCNESGVVCPGISTGADTSQYVMVVITTHMNTTLTRVLGRDQITQIVTAVARSVPGYIDEAAYGNAVVALNRTDCRAFWGHGGADFETVGGGVFVNSTSDCGFTLNGRPNLNTPSITIAGSTSNPMVAGANYNAPQLPPMTMPNPSCGGVIAVKVGNALNAGIVNGSFPPSGVTHLNGGVYCVNGTFSMNGNDTLTGSEVVIRMDSGDIRWNGNGAIQLSAPTVGPFQGLLIFVPPSNQSTITINGTNDQRLTGTILAPTSDIVLLGTAGTNGFNSQIIGYNVEFGGTFDGTIRYDDAQNYNVQYGPQIEQTK
jgi:Flp pilus assembly protein TadG